MNCIFFILFYVLCVTWLWLWFYFTMYVVTNFVVLVSQRQFFTQVDNKVIQYNTSSDWHHSHMKKKAWHCLCVYVWKYQIKKIHCYIFCLCALWCKQTQHARAAWRKFTEWVKETLHSPCVVILLVTLFLWLSSRALHLQCKRLCVQFTGNTHTDKRCIAWMLCKSLWIKVSAKFINVNVTRASDDSLSTSQHFAVSLGTLKKGYKQSLLFWYHSQLLAMETDITAYQTVLYWAIPLSRNEPLRLKVAPNLLIKEKLKRHEDYSVPKTQIRNHPKMAVVDKPPRNVNILEFFSI